MAKKRKASTTGQVRRAAAARKRAKVADKHIGRRGATRTRTVNASPAW
jgi:hypothetical protein